MLDDPQEREGKLLAFLSWDGFISGKRDEPPYKAYENGLQWDVYAGFSSKE
jgi:hypothetical protein